MDEMNPFNPSTSPQPGMDCNSKPDNYLVWAILVTIFCCLPFGIVALVYSAKVDPAWYAGRYAEAYDAASKARTWTLVSAGIGVAWVFIVGLFTLMPAVVSLL